MEKRAHVCFLGKMDFDTPTFSARSDPTEAAAYYWLPAGGGLRLWSDARPVINELVV